MFAEVKFAFDVYDFKGDGKVDGFYIGDLLRACNINPTLNISPHLQVEPTTGAAERSVPTRHAGVGTADAAVLSHMRA